MSEVNLEEKQQKKVKVFSRVAIAVFMVILVLPTLIWGAGTLVAGENMKTLDYDLGENREKASFPEQFTSAYGTEVEAYYNDRLPFRSVIISANRKLTAAVEKPYNESISPYLVKVFYSDYGNETQVASAKDVAADAISENVKADAAGKTDSAGKEMNADDRKQNENTDSAGTDAKATDSGDEKTADGGDNTQTDASEEAKDGDSQRDEKAADEENAGVGENADANGETADDADADSEEAEDEAGEAESENGENAQTEAASTGAAYMPPRVFNDFTIEGRDGWLFFAQEGALDDYLGTNILTNEQMNQYVNGMVRLQDICNAQGKQLYFIVAPNKEIVYSEKMPSYTVVNEYRRGERLIDYIHANSNIKLIYPIEELKAAKAEWQPYFRTDTHWTELGAFIGVQSLYSVMGMPTTDLHSLSVTKQEHLGGDLIGMGNLNQEDYRGDIGYKINYKPEITVGSVDGSLGNDWIYRANSTSPNQCNMVVIGDSFRLFMTSYMAKDFSNYTHVHWKYLEEPTAKEAFKNADIIVIESVERFDWTMLNTLSSVANTLQS